MDIQRDLQTLIIENSFIPYTYILRINFFWMVDFLFEMYFVFVFESLGSLDASTTQLQYNILEHLWV